MLSFFPVCSSICFRKQSSEEAFRRVAGLGFLHMDLGAMPQYVPHLSSSAPQESEIQRIRNLTERHGLALRTLNADCGDYLADFQGAVRIGTTLIRAARSLECPLITVGTVKSAHPTHPTNPARYSLDEDYLQAGRFMRALCEIAADEGVGITVEAHAGCLVRDLSGMLRLFERVDHPALSHTFDTAHHSRGGYPLGDAVKALGDRITHVHLRDHDGQSNKYPLGTGRVDIPGFLKALEEIDYAGGVSLEFTDVGTPEETEEVLRAALELLEGYGLSLPSGAAAKLEEK